ncbi:hypothetical protein [Sulfitobacter guttiformis]|uniref:Helix-turn-helix protein n=1 Tax=Sulfitobacter guttiformis TaxID=74349 RepID=A0A420DHE5_9RHOB|nr:hypothetical protein [Sulfitobacter guttiformis]RKE93627.1 hypothetical protein C8N30_2704 [Sulfitobacter guttiformis]
MDEKPKKPVRRLRKKFKVDTAMASRLKISRLERENAELREQLSGGWISPTKEFCDTKYAARMINKREQTLRNLRSTGNGPKSFNKSGSVYYLVSDLRAFIVEGKTDWRTDDS